MPKSSDKISSSVDPVRIETAHSSPSIKPATNAQNEKASSAHSDLLLLFSFYFSHHRHWRVNLSGPIPILTCAPVPTFSQLQEHYNATYAQINYSVAIPALALAVSPLFWTPFADIYGRRTVCIAGCTLALAATIGSALAPTYSGYMVLRFLQGWGVGPASTVGLQMLQDTYSELERGATVGFWTASIDLGLLFGPLLGGFAAMASFTWPAWLTAIMFGILLVVMLFGMPETAPSTFSHDRKQPFLNVTPIPNVTRPKLWSTTVNCLRMFAYPKVAIPIVFYCWAWYWFIMCPITMIPAAFPTYSPQTQGLLFIGLILGTALAEALCSGRLSDNLVTKFSIAGSRSPEHRLWLYWPAAAATVLGLILFGCSIQFSWHWMIVQVSLAVMAFGVQIGNTTTVSYCVDCYPNLAMDVTAFYSLHLNLSAFASPFFIVPWVTRNGWALSFGLQGLIVAVCTLLVIGPFQWWARRSTTGSCSNGLSSLHFV
ncbi:SubName: Full=Related to MFS transporter, putative-Neosartorya fischeri {ECO:0000313/EMBL:CCA73663.1} [Serendipita indica DSM 11827]|nr:SubName: Full=Related to MFS transporter, putative-Neosartorya fischeri {ECO:0000313/EMBL:CCA73663.1} [Serendipita indica DSM 11827]